jgi:phenylalanyl-tRNA synthetase alpha chain
MTDQLLNMKNEVKAALALAQTPHEVNATKSQYLGKKSPIQELLGKMKELSIEEKKTFGKSVNDFKNFVESEVNKRLEILAALEVEKKLESETIDITLPGKRFPNGYLHPLTTLLEEIEDFFVGMGYQIAEGPEIETDHYNFELLNLPKGHPAREMQDSFYIDPTYLLRTHTSPVQARTMQKAEGKPIKIICPGKVYRRDADDATHSHQFMQVEGLVVEETVTMADLKGTLTFLMKKMYGNNLEIRFRPSFFPFTEPSVEVDVTCFKCEGHGCPLCKNAGWIEVLGAGMVHPNVLEMSGYDSKKYQGFAFGIGIERLAMLRYGIDDIRLFYLNDSRFLKQF